MFNNKLFMVLQRTQRQPAATTAPWPRAGTYQLVISEGRNESRLRLLMSAPWYISKLVLWFSELVLQSSSTGSES